MPDFNENDLPNKPLEIQPEDSSMLKLVLNDPVSENKPTVAYGITEVMDVIDAMAALKNAYDTALADDGKITWTDFLSHPADLVFTPIKSIIKAVDGYPLIIPEIVDIDYSEAEEILKAVMEKFKLEESNAKIIIENSFKALYHIKVVITTL